ncbi:MAG TPA: hypothetical protein VFY65_15475 [Longimicrobium sp.]|nr:hypothetical protein [Longimicrobium sp.]
MTSGGGVMYAVSILSGTVLLLFFSGREPEWAAPLILMMLGVLTVAASALTPKTEPRRARGAVRLRLGVVAAVVGFVLLLRSLGVM